MTEPLEHGGDQVPWRRLDRRMILVDAAQVLVSLAAVSAVTWVFDSSVEGGGWAIVLVGASVTVAAASDAYRWLVTKYRVTDELVERRSGVFVREHRSVRRERIRSVDIHAKLRHRLGGLRLVKIGAGQQASAGEAALDLDAVSRADAHALRSLLLGHVADGSTDAPAEAASADAGAVLARLRARWVVHNVFSVWAFVMAAGLFWGGFWLASLVGIEVGDVLVRVADWESLGLGWTIVAGVAAVTAVGVVGLAVNFFAEYWDFELSRVPTGDGGTVLRTRHGLLTTREVRRDERRMRGIQVAEPLLWRWMGTTETTVITTGLDQAATSQPTAVLPRVPLDTALSVADDVMQTSSNPLRVALETHPSGALRRRLWWATLATFLLVAVLGWLAVTGVIPVAAVWVAVALWPVALVCAVVAYRALGHAIIGDHLVVRSGLISRATTALQRSAVSTVAVRESVLQRRLGLRTVTVMTSAGDGAYAAPDLASDEAIAFAAEAAPHLLDPFLEPSTAASRG